MTRLRTLAQSAGFGRIAYQTWHRPFGWLRDCLREGGPWVQRRTERGRAEMAAAATALPALPPLAEPPLPVHFLTGRRFWYQTAFCLWTLARQTGRPVAAVIHDDGSLDDPTRERIAARFPLLRFADPAEAAARRDELLPAARFPALRERLEHYPHLRKVVDPHLGQSGWKLVADSDLLFFRRPDELVGWLDRPDRPLHAVDCKTSYGYSPAVMDRLAGAPVANLVNVGLAGLNGAELDWDRIEGWCRGLIMAEGKSYYLEQALVAMLVAGRACTVLPAGRYVTMPRPPEANECRAVMHHYVAASKRWYFQANWRRALAAGGGTAP